MEDTQIIDLFFERSEQALRELDDKYGKAVRRTASNLLNLAQDAEECVSDTYLRVWNSIPPQRPDYLGGYVCRIARNLAISRLRFDHADKRASSLDVVLDELEACLPSPVDVESDYEARELGEAINRFLAGLSYDDRFVFVRRYWFADSVKAIARQLGKKEGSVSVRLFRLRNKLKNTLEQEGLLV